MTIAQLYALDVIYKAKRDRSAVFIYGRSDKGRAICLLDRKYLPSFSVKAVSGISAEKLREVIEKSIVQTGMDGGGIKNLVVESRRMPFRAGTGEFVRVYCRAEDLFRVMDAVSSLAEASDFYETDIPVARRYLIDNGLVPTALSEAEGEFINYPGKVSVMEVSSVAPVSNESIPSPKILSLSVLRAVDVAGKNFGDDENVIASVSLFGSQTDHSEYSYVRVLVNASLVASELPKEGGNIVIPCSSDADVLEKLQKEIDVFMPDFIVGFGSDANDLPFLAERAESLGVRFSPALDSSRIRIRRRPRKQARIVGMPHLDLSGALYRRIASSVARSKVLDFDVADYSVHALSELILSPEERSSTIASLDGMKELSLLEMWKSVSKGASSFLSVPEDAENFLEAVKDNVVSSAMISGLSSKLMPYLLELCKITGIEPFSASRFGASGLIEWHLIRSAVSRNFVVPKRPSPEEARERRETAFSGAFVLEPKTGIHKNVAVCDFRGLYPSIIAEHNISPDTLKCGCCRDSAEKILLDDGSKAWFCTKMKGFFPSLLEELLSRRERIESILAMSGKDGREVSPMLKARSDMLKLVSNSFYGYLGFPNSRWYSLDCVRAVTALGRRYIERALEIAKGEGFDVVYSDTDSVFFKAERKMSLVEFEKSARKFADMVNLELPKRIKLEFVGAYPAILFVESRSRSEGRGKHAGAKKKYALLTGEGEIVVRGFESVRRNWSPIARKVQNQVLRILLEESIERALDEAVEIVRTVVRDVRNRKVPNREVVISTVLQRDVDDYDISAPHVEAARRMISKGLLVEKGSLISYIVVPDGENAVSGRVRLPAEVPEGGYDSEYYVKHQILPAVEGIFSTFGRDIDVV